MAISHPDYSNPNYDNMAKAIGLKPKHMPLLIASFIEETQAIFPKLQVAVKANDYDKIGSLSHSIKGSAGNMRFNELYDMAKEMELAGKESNATFEYAEYLEAIITATATIKI